MVKLEDQDLKIYTVLKEKVQRSLGKRYLLDVPEVQCVKNVLVHGNVHQKASTAEGLNNQVNKIANVRLFHQPPQGFLNRPSRSSHGGSSRSCAWIQQQGLLTQNNLAHANNEYLTFQQQKPIFSAQDSNIP